MTNEIKSIDIGFNNYQEWIRCTMFMAFNVVPSAQRELAEMAEREMENVDALLAAYMPVEDIDDPVGGYTNIQECNREVLRLRGALVVLQDARHEDIRPQQSNKTSRRLALYLNEVLHNGRDGNEAWQRTSQQ